MKTKIASHKTDMDTIILTLDKANSFKVPPFQRPIRANEAVLRIANDMKTSQTIVGVITLGKLAKDTAEYIVDGQHRIEAFRISALPEVLADVRIIHFDAMAEMAEEFIRLNTALVRMRPDDLLRGLTPLMPPLQLILSECHYVGYDSIRRSPSNAMVSFASALRCWAGSEAESPSAQSRGGIANIASAFSMTTAETMAGFMRLAYDAWGRDPEYHRMWGNLNMILCMWLYRRMVLDTVRKGTQRTIVINAKEFKSCLMALSANANYVAWLQGRTLRELDRSPAFARIKAIFTKTLSETRSDKVRLPQPAWSS